MNCKDILKLTAAGIVGGVIALAGDKLITSPCPTAACGAEDAMRLNSGYQMNLDCTKKTDSYTVGSSPLEVAIPTRVISSGSDAFLYWRNAQFSSDGHLLSIGKETGSICFHISSGDSFETEEMKERRRENRIKEIGKRLKELQKKGDGHGKESLLQ